MENPFDNGVFLFGFTGAGKSTLFNFLLGVDYELSNHDLKPKSKEYSISSKQSISLTKEITIIQKDGVFLVDTPGLEDNRGP